MGVCIYSIINTIELYKATQQITSLASQPGNSKSTCKVNSTFLHSKVSSKMWVLHKSSHTHLNKPIVANGHRVYIYVTCIHITYILYIDLENVKFIHLCYVYFVFCDNLLIYIDH